MKQAIYETRGPIPHDVIHAVEKETPVPQGDQVLVAVLAAPINPSDVLMLTGEYGMLPDLPAVGGSEGVGRVAAVGSEVTGLSVGQTVLLPVGSGTWASHVLAPAKRLVPLPNDADPQQLAMVSVNPPTASLMLSEYVKLQPGDWVIQNVANSGVGSYVTQLAKIRGLRTVNIVRRESAADTVTANGGDVVLVDGKELAKRVKAATDKEPIKLGIDAVGGEATNRIASCLAFQGTVVTYGSMSGEPSVMSPQFTIFRDITLRGFWLAMWFQQAARDAQMAVYGELTGLIAAGKLKTKIHAVYDVANIQDAIKAATQSGRSGKVLIGKTE